MDYPGKVITKNQVTPTQTSATGVWTLDDAAAAVKNNNWPVAGVPNPISKSLRFNSADSAYLNRTPASASNRTTWTYSVWLKRSSFAAFNRFLSDSSNNSYLRFNTSDALDWNFWNGTTSYTITTSQVFRDPSAWYHIMVAVDTTQATSSNRVKFYVNGSQITAFSSASYPAQNNTSNFNNNTAHYISSYGGSAEYYNGYLTEINFIDGQALTPSSFGMTDPQTGAWEPIRYTGTYGTNGFYLNFKDATSTTTLGNDYSGNNNNWTTNNFSVTAGSGNDSLTDVPTPWIAYNTTGDVGGVVRGNYATLNPLAKSSVGTLDNGNLQWTSGNSGGGTAGNGTRASIGMNVGKWYTEVTRLDTVFWSYPGISNESHLTSTYNGGDANSWSIDGSGQKTTNNSSSAYGSASWAANDIINIAYDADNGELYFGKNGTWLNSGNPATRTNPAFTSLSGTLFFTVGFSANTASASSVVFNFGQRPFAYTPPAGFRSLCTTNLPNPTIGTLAGSQAGNFFNANLYTGTGSAFTLTGVGFQPDFGWFKGRNASSNHWLHDVVRGANPGLSSNSTAVEDTTAGQLTAFASDGYSLPNDTAGYLNFSGRTMVVWSWKANGAGSSNTSGTITSTVSANTTAGFSIVSYTGNGSNSTVGHGLGVAPSMIILKNRDDTDVWMVQHTSLGPTKYIILNRTDAEGTASTVWNNTAPTSSVFSIGTLADVNTNTEKYIAYCFAAVAGYSAFGSYTGNGSTDGPFVYLGFRPRFVMIKRSDSNVNTPSWMIWDTARSTFNATVPLLYPNTADAESNAANWADILSNGFKLRNTDSWNNASGGTYIYAAFAEFPFKFANAR